MSNILDQVELDGLRADFFEMLGMHVDTNGDFVDDTAKTTVIITRITDRGPLNTTTGLYDAPVSSQIYVGPAHISPVTYRRDRQEIGGMEAVRIRQYRAIVPWDSGDVWIDDSSGQNRTRHWAVRVGARKRTCCWAHPGQP